jgi:oligogalacturonide transport system substrate-binding protein
MKKVSRILALSLAVLTVGSIMAGCKSSTTAGTSSSEASNKPVTLRFSWWGSDSRHKATLKVIDAYKKVAPNVTIEAEYQGWDGYENKKVTELAGGQQPDILQASTTDIVTWGTKYNVFVNLSKQTIFDLKQFDQTFLKSFGTVKGNIIGVPTGENSYNLFVNKNVIEKAGVTVPENMTWDDFMALGKKIHSANPDLYLITNNDDGWNHMLRSYMRQLTGKWPIDNNYTVTTDKKSLTTVFTFLQDCYTSGVAEPMASVYPYYTNMGQDKKWLSNQIAFCYSASSAIDNMRKSVPNLDVVNIPIVKGTKTTGVITQPSQILAVSNNKNKNESLKFMQYFFADKDSILALNTQRGVPATKAGRDLLTQNNLLDALINKAVSSASKVSDTAYPSVSESPQVYNVCFPLIQQVCYKKITPAEAAQQYITQNQSAVNAVKQQG